MQGLNQFYPPAPAACGSWGWGVGFDPLLKILKIRIKEFRV